MARPKGSSKSKDVKAVEEKAEQLTMQVDKQEFIRTRDAVCLLLFPSYFGGASVYTCNILFALSAWS